MAVINGQDVKAKSAQSQLPILQITTLHSTLTNTNTVAHFALYSLHHIVVQYLNIYTGEHICVHICVAACVCA